MAVELVDLVGALSYTVSPPGMDLFPDATETMWLEYLRNGFWEASLDGVITGYDEEDGAVTPVSGDVDLPRITQQVIVLWAAIAIARSYLLNSKTAFRAKAGPVEYETRMSGPLMEAILADLLNRRQEIIDNLSTYGGSASFYYDGVTERNCSILYGVGWAGY